MMDHNNRKSSEGSASKSRYPTKEQGHKKDPFSLENKNLLRSLKKVSQAYRVGMKFSRSLSLLFLSAQSLCSSAWITAPPSFRTSSSLIGRYATVEGTETSSKAVTGSSLLPEFDAALQAAQSKLLALVPEEKKQGNSGMLSLLQHFILEYMTACQAAYLAGNKKECNPAAAAERILKGIGYGFRFGMGEDTYKFDVSHKALRGNPDLENGNTVDYYAFGCDFFRPCMDLEHSPILGEDNLKQAMDQLAAGENVVLLANHQSEADPQVVSCLLEKAGYEQEAADMLYIAGHKVTTDPLAIPFSMGRNLICIHSKKHINADPETRPIKQKQNLKAMSGMLNKLKKGGCLIWVAPSGGRDRRDVETNTVPLAPFDSKTIDMFRLMGNKSNVRTHFYPLAMVTYNLCPPPDTIEADTGEQRNVRFVPVGIAMGEELDNEGGLETRHKFCETAMKQCQEDYEKLIKAVES